MDGEEGEESGRDEGELCSGELGGLVKRIWFLSKKSGRMNSPSKGKVEE